MTTTYIKTKAEEQLTERERMVIDAIKQNGGMTRKEITVELGYKNITSIQGLMLNLEIKGLVRVDDTGAVKVIKLTTAGMTANQEA